MAEYQIWDSEYRFMCIVWENAPIGSGKLVELCAAELGWKKSTTYNAIRKMCEKDSSEMKRHLLPCWCPRSACRPKKAELS